MIANLTLTLTLKNISLYRCWHRPLSTTRIHMQTNLKSFALRQSSQETVPRGQRQLRALRNLSKSTKAKFFLIVWKKESWNCYIKTKNLITENLLGSEFWHTRYASTEKPTSISTLSMFLCNCWKWLHVGKWINVSIEMYTCIDFFLTCVELEYDY